MVAAGVGIPLDIEFTESTTAKFFSVPGDFVRLGFNCIVWQSGTCVVAIVPTGWNAGHNLKKDLF